MTEEEKNNVKLEFLSLLSDYNIENKETREYKKEILKQTHSKIYYDDDMQNRILEISKTGIKKFFNTDEVIMGK